MEAVEGVQGYPTEDVPLDALKPHPKNYRRHPEDQLQHLVQSIRDHGFYRNIVIARDGTILAGHGVWEASRLIGSPTVPCIRVPLDPDSPLALKILTGDNELPRRAEVDDRQLSEILKAIQEADPSGLLGTGYDEQMLASLVYVTRPRSEIESFDEAAHWAGMPEFDGGEQPYRLVVSFDTAEERDQFLGVAGITYVHKKLTETSRTWSAWWPDRRREDLASLRFAEDGREPEETPTDA